MHALTGVASSRGVTARAAVNQKATIPWRPKSEAAHTDLSRQSGNGGSVDRVMTESSLTVD